MTLAYLGMLVGSMEVIVIEHKVRSLAHQLLEILEAYQASFAQWCQSPSDVGRYERTRANLDLVRVLAAKAFPAGRGEFGELLLYHGDIKILVLKRHIARSSGRPLLPASDEQLEALRDRHDAMVTALRVICRQRSGGPPEPAVRRSRVETQLVDDQQPLADA
jgi:hypothetical protein